MSSDQRGCRPEIKSGHGALMKALFHQHLERFQSLHLNNGTPVSSGTLELEVIAVPGKPFNRWFDLQTAIRSQLDQWFTAWVVPWLNNSPPDTGKWIQWLQDQQRLTLDEVGENDQRTADVEFTELLSISNGELIQAVVKSVRQGLDLTQVNSNPKQYHFWSELGMKFRWFKLGQRHLRRRFQFSNCSKTWLQSSSSWFSVAGFDCGNYPVWQSDLSLKNQLILDEVSEKIIPALRISNWKVEFRCPREDHKYRRYPCPFRNVPNLFQTMGVGNALPILIGRLRRLNSGPGWGTEPEQMGSITRITRSGPKALLERSVRGRSDVFASCQGFDETGPGSTFMGFTAMAARTEAVWSRGEEERPNQGQTFKPWKWGFTFPVQFGCFEVSMDTYQLTFDKGTEFTNHLAHRRMIILLTETSGLGDQYTNLKMPNISLLGRKSMHSIFTNLNDDIKSDWVRSPRLLRTRWSMRGRVILDGSASYDPDLRLDRSIHLTQFTTEDPTLNRADQVLNFIAPQIDVDSKGLVFQLVQDNDGTVGVPTDHGHGHRPAALVEGGVARCSPKPGLCSTDNPDGPHQFRWLHQLAGLIRPSKPMAPQSRFTLPMGHFLKWTSSRVSFNLNRMLPPASRWCYRGTRHYIQVSSTGKRPSASVLRAREWMSSFSGANLAIADELRKLFLRPRQMRTEVYPITTQLNPDGSLQIDLGSCIRRSRNAKSTSEVSSSDPVLHFRWIPPTA